MSKLPAALGDYYAYVGKSSGAADCRRAGKAVNCEDNYRRIQKNKYKTDKNDLS